MKTLKLSLFLFAITLYGCNEVKETKEASLTNETETTRDQTHTVTFPSLDSLEVTAKVYEIDMHSPVILLCHQARFNKFEYEGIAQKLNQKGFNCIAIDQRSGGPIASKPNETTQRALKANKSTEFIDAEQDIIAAINFAFNKYKRPVILWGSSYSSTLALYIAMENEKVDAVISFSPGNYLSEYKGDLINQLPNLKKPMFITSSKYEAPGIKELISKMTLNKHQVHFTPNGNGHHGSRALWPNQEGEEEYWKAIDHFLEHSIISL
ncbi:alpha/beta hydrolase [Xanthovirga aplysinae]|uniref:alpha/beta hydrolase n=1 Tax=Xanthovirga aplysinae TaxID=2529853 RepID=UPI0012BD774F|nr:alpha/beta hydrolase [Xanthovirga aplysinae]MTI33585.1 hypothetical protein [Xanthovirga aplysinae]